MTKTLHRRIHLSCELIADAYTCRIYENEIEN
jgi:hypothetical protein